MHHSRHVGDDAHSSIPVLQRSALNSHWLSTCFLNIHARNYSRIFEEPSRPNMAWLSVVYIGNATPPTFLIGNNLCDLVYLEPTGV